MERRRLLATVGAVAASAGCLAPGDGDPTDTVTPTDGTEPTETPTDTATPADPPDASDEFAGIACPSYADADRTVCYHTAGEDEDVVLTAEPEVFDPDRGDDTVEAVEFSLYNRDEWTVLVNPYDWSIHRRDGSSWSRVAPEGPTQDPLYILEPGDSLRWELPETTHPSPGGDKSYRVDTALESGVYAFSVTGRYSATNLTATPTGGPPAGRTEYVALFRLEPAVGDAADADTEATATQ